MIGEPYTTISIKHLARFSGLFAFYPLSHVANLSPLLRGIGVHAGASALLTAGNLRFLLLRLMQVAFVHQILHHIRQIFSKSCLKSFSCLELRLIYNI